MTEQFSNAYATVLAAPMTSGDLTATVVSAAGAPASGNFRLRIDDEIMTVTAVAGTMFTVSRATEAVNGVTAASAHAVAAVVTHIVTASSLAQAIDDAIAAYRPPTLLDVVVSYDNDTGIATARFRDGTTDITGTDYADVVNQAACSLTAYGLAVPHLKFNGVTAHYAYPTAPTLALGASGAVTSGYHYVAVTFTALRDGVVVESPMGISAGIQSAGERINVTVPVGPAGTTGRRVYVSKATNAEGNAFAPGNGFWPGVEVMFLGTAIADNTTTAYVFNTVDGSMSSTSASDSVPTKSDGGSIGLARAEGTLTTPQTVAGATPMKQGIQIYTQQSLYGAGMGSRFLAQAAYTTQIGTIAASGQIANTTQTTADVTETVTPPAVPFLCQIQDDASAGGEFFMVTARTLVSGSTYTYTFNTTSTGWGKRRGTTIVASGYMGTRPDVHSTGTKVYACDWGAGRLGAMVDAYNADRVRIEGCVLDGGPSATLFTGAGGIAPVGILQKRNKSSDTGGDNSTSRIQFNDVTNCSGVEIMIGRCDDPYATSNVWVEENRALGGNGCGLGVFLGDGHYRRNNVPAGVPAALFSGNTISATENHFGAQPVTGSIVDAGCVFLRGGSDLTFCDNYVDNIRVRGIYRPANLSSQNTYQINDNYFNGAAAGAKWIELDNITASSIEGNHGEITASGFMVDLTTTNAGIVMRGNIGSTDATGSGHNFFNAADLAPAVCEDCSTPGKRSNGHWVSASIATGANSAHGLGIIPTWYVIHRTDATPSAEFADSADATNITVHFAGGGSHVFMCEAFLI